MTSEFKTACDAIIAELQTGATSGLGAVTGLDTTTVPADAVHRLEPWHPQILEPDGRRHLSVRPLGEGNGTADLPEPLALGYHDLTQRYVILVWEDAGIEMPRGMDDETGAESLLQVWQNVRDRLYKTANQQMAGSWRTWYAGTELPDPPADNVRWFRIAIDLHRTAQFT